LNSTLILDICIVHQLINLITIMKFLI